MAFPNCNCVGRLSRRFKMQVPLEIMISIASHLDAKSLCNFRLASQKCAKAGISLIPQNGLSVLNTPSSLRDLKELLQESSISTNTRHLTIVQAIWPVCTRQKWEIHPLLSQGRSNPRLCFPDVQKSCVDEAFAAYSEFIKEQLAWKYHEVINNLLNILRLLPNLSTVKVASAQMWVWNSSKNVRYHKLIKRIWMAPHLDYEVSATLQSLLLAFESGFDNIKNLHVVGEFNPSFLIMIPLASYFASIQYLNVDTFKAFHNGDDIKKFLQAFFNITELFMAFQGMDPSIINVIGQLFWHCLQILHMNDIWASEDEIFECYRKHSGTLTCFGMHNASLTQGSWRGLFTRMRSLKAQAGIVAGGELYGRKSKHTLDLRHKDTSLLLEKFLQDPSMHWPF